MIKSAVASMASDLKILCADDEEEARTLLNLKLRGVFAEVILASDGEEGFKLFLERSPHIVLIDAEMPKIDGFEMAARIREASRTVPIAIVSAHSRHEYFMRAIALGVNHYILKPFESSELFYGTIGVMTKLALEQMAETRRKEADARRRVTNERESVLETAIAVCPIPVAVCGNFGAARAVMNEPFKRMFSESDIEKIRGGEPIERFFESFDLSLSTSWSRKEDEGERSFAQIKVPSGLKKIYLTNKRRTRIGTLNREMIVYTFIDVTREQYERQKAENLIKYLRSLLTRRRLAAWESEAAAEPINAPQNDAQNRTITAQNDAKSVEENDFERILRRSRPTTIDAASYIASIDCDFLEEISDLNESDDDLEIAIESLKLTGGRAYIDDIIKLFRKQALTIAMLSEFNDLSFALDNLCDTLKKIGADDIDYARLAFLLDSVRQDLTNWRKTIFIERTARDIHYLDSSLLSSCLQIAQEFCGENKVDGGDLELF